MSDDDLPRLHSFTVSRFQLRVPPSVLVKVRRQDFVHMYVSEKRSLSSQHWIARAKIDISQRYHWLPMLALHLEDTVLLEDTEAHYQHVLKELPSGIDVYIGMRPTDAMIRRVYGPLDPHWHAATVRFRSQCLFMPDMWVGTLMPVPDWPSEDVVWMLFRPPVKTLECAKELEKQMWEPRRSMFIGKDRRTEKAVSLAALSVVFTIIYAEHTANDCEHIFTMTEPDALTAHRELLAIPEVTASQCDMRLSRPGYVFEFDRENDKTVERRVPWELPYLREQCCGAALALCTICLPVYVVLWIVQFLPSMYRLKDHEAVRLIEGVYNSRKQILALRDERKRNKREDE